MSQDSVNIDELADELGQVKAAWDKGRSHLGRYWEPEELRIRQELEQLIADMYQLASNRNSRR